MFHRLSVLLAVVGAATSVAAQPPAFDRSGATVVLRYQEIIGALAADDPGPSVEVFGDGRVVVRYPAYMKAAGVYTTQIALAEVEAMVAEVVDAGIADFNHDAVARELRQAQAARAAAAQPRASQGTIVTYVSDPSTTVIEAHLQPEPGKRSSKKVAAARWTGLAGDAEKYPEVETLKDLAGAEQRLRALMQREDLRKTE